MFLDLEEIDYAHLLTMDSDSSSLIKTALIEQPQQSQHSGGGNDYKQL